MSNFSDIWLPLADRFYRVAFYLLESESDAEDAVQELYLKLWSTRSSMADVRNPFAYGVSILKNMVTRVRPWCHVLRNTLRQCICELAVTVICHGKRC